RAQPSHDAMHFHELLWGHRFRTVQDLSRAIVGFANLSLLLIRQRHDSQRQDLVDLGAIEQVSGTLRSNLRIVVEDDGRGEHSISLPRLAYENGPRANVLTTRRKFLQFCGRLQ